MAKPIFVIRFPLKYKQDIEKITKNVGESLGQEYYILTIIDELCEAIAFECYNADKEEEVKLEDLKERLTILMESALYRLNEIRRQEEEARKHKMLTPKEEHIAELFRKYSTSIGNWEQIHNEEETNKKSKFWGNLIK